MPALNQLIRTFSYGLVWQRSKIPFLILTSKILTCGPHQTQVETGIYFIVVDGPNALLEAYCQPKRSHMTQEKILNFPELARFTALAKQEHEQSRS